jgi:hypothetical protein
VSQYINTCCWTSQHYICISDNLCRRCSSWDIRAPHGCLRACLVSCHVSVHKPVVIDDTLPRPIKPSPPSNVPESLVPRLYNRAPHTHSQWCIQKKNGHVSKRIYCCGTWTVPQSDSGNGTVDFTLFLNPFWAGRPADTLYHFPSHFTSANIETLAFRRMFESLQRRQVK